MLVELVRLLLVAGLLVVLPGWLLVNALFPRHRSHLRGLERGYMVVGGGVLVLILVGVLLGLIPHARTGFFQTMAVGFPHVELAMLAVSLLLGYVGLQRGAYPRVAARYPRLLGVEAPAPVRPLGPQMR
jgi:uncharacterized membrane protein